MGKKRKIELDIELERSMYSSFVSAANAVSQLYTQGVQQQRRAAAAASRATLEKVVTFVLRTEEGSEAISKAALLAYLQHEYENVDSPDVPALAPQQMQLMPFGGAACAGADDTADAHQHKASRHMHPGSMLASPGGRAGSCRMMGVDEQQQQQQQQAQQQQQQAQQQQQQQEHAAQQQQAMLMHMAAPPFTGHAHPQQQQQQHAMGGMFSLAPGQPPPHGGGMQ